MFVDVSRLAPALAEKERPGRSITSLVRKSATGVPNAWPDSAVFSMVSAVDAVR
jgi:hypothetical protein